MAEVWQAGSTVRLCFVPWDSGYNDVVRFATKEAQAAYFDDATACAPSLLLGKQTYVRPNVPLTVDGPYSQIHRFNYCVVDNPSQPVENSEPERLFYFITNAEYVSPASTRITLQLDVWQTRVIHDGCTFGSCYCERGHAGVVQSIVTPDDQRYLTVPEDLNIGSDYLDYPVSVTPLGRPCVIVLSTADLTADPGTVDSPQLKTATGQIVEGMPSGSAAYLFNDPDQFLAAMRNLSETPWVAQCILGIYYVPGNLVEGIDGQVECAHAIAYTQFHAKRTAFGIDLPGISYYEQVCAYGELAETYRKILVYPYTLFELTNYQGSPVLLKPELLKTDKLYLDSVGVCLPPFTRFGLAPQGYAGGGAGDYVDASGEGFDGSQIEARVYAGQWLDSALWFDNLPQFSTVNNSYLTYLASSTHSREFSYDAAGWGLDRSQAATRNAYEQSQRGMATQSANQQISNELQDFSQLLGGIGTVGGVVGNLLGGNVGGALGSAASGLMQYAQSEASQRAGNAQFQNNMGLASANADANRRLSEYTAQSSYQQAIAGINAKVQDAALTPPSTVGQQGGNGLAVANGLYQICLRVKCLQSGDVRRVLEYFSRYGYAVHEYVRFQTSTLCPMKEVTYWKCQDVPVTCATATDTEVMAIKGIFSQGVSVYADPAKIGAVDILGNTVSDMNNYYLVD